MFVNVKSSSLYDSSIKQFNLIRTTEKNVSDALFTFSRRVHETKEKTNKYFLDRIDVNIYFIKNKKILKKTEQEIEFQVRKLKKC